MCNRNNSYNDRYINYFENQCGSGMSIYHGAKLQRGYGLASFLKSMWRLAVPLFKSGARSLAQEGITSGFNFANDLMERKNAKQSFESRLKEAGSNLKRKAEDKLTRMQGAGLKRMKQQRTLQLVASDRERKVAAKKRKSPSSKPRKIFKKPKASRKLRDIFE